MRIESDSWHSWKIFWQSKTSSTNFPNRHDLFRTVFRCVMFRYECYECATNGIRNASWLCVNLALQTLLFQQIYFWKDRNTPITGSPLVREKSGKFKVRENSGNFRICQGNLEFCRKSGKFKKSKGNLRKFIFLKRLQWSISISKNFPLTLYFSKHLIYNIWDMKSVLHCTIYMQTKEKWRLGV